MGFHPLFTQSHLRFGTVLLPNAGLSLINAELLHIAAESSNLCMY